MKEAESSTQAFEAMAASAGSEHYVLRLFIAGATVASARSVEALRQVCEKHLHGRYELSVVDIFQQPVLAKNEQIIAVPTLIKRLPTPLRKIVGDLSDEQRLLIGLDLKPKAHDDARESKS